MLYGVIRFLSIQAFALGQEFTLLQIHQGAPMTLQF